MSRVHTPVAGAMADYVRSVFVREPAALEALRLESETHPEASCQVAPEQGQLLNLLVRAAGVRRALEVGVFLGYSSTWVALGLPEDGRLVACDVSEEYTARARRTWREAGVESRIELRLGPALETLDALLAAGEAGAFDFAFIDADKRNYQGYFERALRLVRTGGLIAVDNVLWHGRVADPAEQDADTCAIRAFNQALSQDARVAVSLAAMGDGIALAVKL